MHLITFFAVIPEYPMVEPYHIRRGRMPRVLPEEVKLASYLDAPREPSTPWPTLGRLPVSLDRKFGLEPPVIEHWEGNLKTMEENARFFISKRDPSLAEYMPRMYGASDVQLVMGKDGRPRSIGGGNYSQCLAATFRGRPAVVKLFRRTALSYEAIKNPLERVVLEACILRRLEDTKATPRCLGLVTLREGQFFAMGIVQELVGEADSYRTLTLQALIDSDPSQLKRASPDWTELGLQIALQVEKVHQCGVMLNDLKPDNIVLHWTGERWVPVLIDVGLATYQNTTSPYNREGLNRFLAKLPQVAPESWKGSVTEKSDCYGLGFVFECMAKKASTDQTLLEGMGRTLRRENPDNRPTPRQIADAVMAGRHTFQ